MIDMLDAVKANRGPVDAVNLVAAENSMGFHAPQETARILAASINFSRQAQLFAPKLQLTPPH